MKKSKFLFVATTFLLVGTLAVSYAERRTTTEASPSAAAIDVPVPTANEPPGISTCRAQDGRPCHGTGHIKCSSGPGSTGTCYCVDGSWICVDGPVFGTALELLAPEQPPAAMSCLE